MKRTNRDTPARAAMKMLCTFLGVVFLVMLSATLYFQHLFGGINHVSFENVPLLSQEELDALLDTPVLNIADSLFDDHNTQIGGRGSGIVNILLIGQDRREGEDRARSDSMILCTFNKDTKKITMTSFLRDLYVEIPGYSSNRINAAYAAGGMTLLNKTLKENFGVHIDGNVEVDFSQFSQIVDLLGGVQIELQQDEANVVNEETGSTLEPGLQTLNGAQALAYSRIRKLDADGDFSRTNRQRTVMRAMVDAYKGVKLTNVLSLVKQVLPMISTDMSNGRILTLALELFPLLSDAEIVSQRIPADGTYSGQMIDGMSVLVADMEANRKILSDSLTQS